MGIIERATVLQNKIDARITVFNKRVSYYDWVCLGFYLLIMSTIVSYYYYCVMRGHDVFKLNVPAIYHPLHFLGLSLIVFFLIIMHRFRRDK